MQFSSKKKVVFWLFSYDFYRKSAPVWFNRIKVKFWDFSIFQKCLWQSFTKNIYFNQARTMSDQDDFMCDDDEDYDLVIDCFNLHELNYLN